MRKKDSIMAGKVRYSCRSRKSPSWQGRYSTAVGAGSWMLTFPSMYRKERKNRKWDESIYPQSPPQWQTSSVKALPPKDSIRSSNSSTPTGPGVQIQEPMGDIFHSKNDSSLHLPLFPWHQAERRWDKWQMLSIVNEKADGILERAGSFLLSHSETTVWVFPKPPCSLRLPWQVRTGNKEITALIISLLQMSVLIC